MKKILTICALTVVLAAVFIWRATAKPSRFGTFTGAPKAEVAIVDCRSRRHFWARRSRLKAPSRNNASPWAASSTFKFGKDSLRVDLQEVAMHAPMREGGAARVEGQMVPFNDGYQFYASAVEFK